MLSKYNEIRARRARGEQGFTLIELLVVVVIIGILIAIAIPIYLNYQKSSHDKATGSDVRQIVTAMENCNTDYNTYPTAVADVSGKPGTKSLTGCGDTPQDVNISDGTNLKYTPSASTAPVSSFTLCGWNTNGNSDAFFYYDSTNGGTVSQSTTDCSK